MLLSKGVEPARTPWKWFALKGTLGSYLLKSSNVGPAKMVTKTYQNKQLAGAKQVYIKVSFQTEGQFMSIPCHSLFFLHHVIISTTKKKTSPPARKVRAAGPGAALWTENQLFKVVWKVQRSAKLPPGFQPRRLLKLQGWK